MQSREGGDMLRIVGLLLLRGRMLVFGGWRGERSISLCDCYSNIYLGISWKDDFYASGIFPGFIWFFDLCFLCRQTCDARLAWHVARTQAFVHACADDHWVDHDILLCILFYKEIVRRTWPLTFDLDGSNHGTVLFQVVAGCAVKIKPTPKGLQTIEINGSGRTYMEHEYVCMSFVFLLSVPYSVACHEHGGGPLALYSIQWASGVLVLKWLISVAI